MQFVLIASDLVRRNVFLVNESYAGPLWFAFRRSRHIHPSTVVREEAVSLWNAAKAELCKNAPAPQASGRSWRKFPNEDPR